MPIIEINNKLGLPRAIEMRSVFISEGSIPSNNDIMGVIKRMGKINNIHITNNFTKIIEWEENPIIWSSLILPSQKSSIKNCSELRIIVNKTTDHITAWPYSLENKLSYPKDNMKIKIMKIKKKIFIYKL